MPLCRGKRSTPKLLLRGSRANELVPPWAPPQRARCRCLRIATNVGGERGKNRLSPLPECPARDQIMVLDRGNHLSSRRSTTPRRRAPSLEEWQRRVGGPVVPAKRQAATAAGNGLKLWPPPAGFQVHRRWWAACSASCTLAAARAFSASASLAATSRFACALSC